MTKYTFKAIYRQNNPKYYNNDVEDFLCNSAEIQQDISVVGGNTSDTEV